MIKLFIIIYNFFNYFYNLLFKLLMSFSLFKWFWISGFNRVRFLYFKLLLIFWRFWFFIFLILIFITGISMLDHNIICLKFIRIFHSFFSFIIFYWLIHHMFSYIHIFSGVKLLTLKCNSSGWLLFYLWILSFISCKFHVLIKPMLTSLCNNTLIYNFIKKNSFFNHGSFDSFLDYYVDYFNGHFINYHIFIGSLSLLFIIFHIKVRWECTKKSFIFYSSFNKSILTIKILVCVVIFFILLLLFFEDPSIYVIENSNYKSICLKYEKIPDLFREYKIHYFSLKFLIYYFVISFIFLLLYYRFFK